MTYQQLVPDSDNKFSHEYYYQVPDSPRGVVALFHGCVGSGSNYWPQSAACAECRGMPEQMSHTLQALRRGYAGEVARGRRRLPLLAQAAALAMPTA